MKTKHILGCLGVAVVLLLALAGLQKITFLKTEYVEKQSFFQEEEDYDILFFGSSHVLDSVYPMELWKDYGIVSYNWGIASGILPMSYWTMRIALEQTSPKLVVIDVYTLSGARKTPVDGQFFNLYRMMSCFPFSKTKVQAVLDLLNDSVPTDGVLNDTGSNIELQKASPLNLLWGLPMYHSRWSELTREDFVPALSPEKGAVTGIHVLQREKPTEVSLFEEYDEESIGVEYLRKMIEECQARGIDVLLVYLPAYSIEWEKNRAQEIAEEYGVNYVDLIKQDIIDYETDCSDSGGHINASGSRKVTDYLGQYITGHYDIPDRRQDTAYSGWYDDYDAYTQFKEDNLKAQTAFDTYLMLLADKNYDCVFYLNDNSLFKSGVHGGVYRALLENLGIDTAALEREDCWIITRQGGQAAQMWPVPDSGNGTWDTALGKLQLRGGQGTLDGELCLTLIPNESLNYLQAAILATEDHRLADRVTYNLDTCEVMRG